MLHFANDYTQGACQEILDAIVKTNFENLSGYGADKYCESAKAKIRKACELENADVYFLVGGTQTNVVVINSMLQSYEGVIVAETGHISVHEAGAIELTGHKVLTLPHHNGKINVNEVKGYLQTFYADENHEHMVFPGIVYISHPTEYGTLYTKNELTEISEICKKYKIPLFLDGARLAYGLMAKDTDVTLPDIARLCDVFYFGGTKVGALLGEAVVFTKNNTPKNFVTRTKQHGALLAKGRLLRVQFDTLFLNNWYKRIGKHTINLSEKLKNILYEKNYKFYLESSTNQQFIVIENIKMEELEKK
ncbi:threonine aldolase family protein [Leptotrichia hongkongensis]|uniref:threonine aldolase family protein n=1 Tax=Leptotrichia hongkongensis TaxID=554406 RepID=UPI0035A8A87D